MLTAESGGIRPGGARHETEQLLNRQLLSFCTAFWEDVEIGVIRCAQSFLVMFNFNATAMSFTCSFEHILSICWILSMHSVYKGLHFWRCSWIAMRSILREEACSSVSNLAGEWHIQLEIVELQKWIWFFVPSWPSHTWSRLSCWETP